MIDNLNYEHQISNTYIVFQTENFIEKHALKMMCYNKIQYLLSVNEKTVNNCTYLYYDITNLNNIFEYAKNHAIEYTLIKALVKSVFEILDLTREFFLSEECFLINDETIFLDSNLKSIYFLYIPFDTRPYNFHQQIHTLLTSLLQIVNKQDEKAISLLYKLRIIVEEQNFGITAFKDLIEHEDEIINPAIIQNKENISTEVIIPNNKTASNNIKSKTILNFLFTQIMMLLIVFISCNKLIVPETDIRFMWLKLIILLTVTGIFETIIVSRILMPKIVNKKSKGVIRLIREFKKVKNKVKHKKEDNNGLVKRWNWKEECNSKQREEEIKNERAYLISDAGIKIPIIKTPFIIGKTKEAVDLCIQNDLVSRVHCQIINEEKKFYLIDLDSCNGTFIKDILLERKKEYLLTHGDWIRIGVNTYSFMVI